MLSTFTRPLFVVLLMAVASAWPAQAQHGKLVFSDTTHSFGTIPEGEEAMHVFTFRNDGDVPLHLTKVRPSCGCTTPEWTRDAVEPGDTGRIKVVYHSDGRPGPFHRTIDIWSDGAPGLATLHIEGNVRSRPLENADTQGNLLIDEATVDLGAFEHSVAAVHTFQIQNNGDQPIRITNIKPPANNVTIQFPSTPLLPGDIGNVVVFIDTTPLQPGAPFAYTLTLETDDVAQPQKSLKLKGSTSAAE